MVILMDTLAIYEQFRSVLGDEKAKGFAQTIGTMIEEAKNAATKDDIRSLEGHVDRLDNAIVKLAEAQTRTENRLDRLEAAVEKLAEAQARTEERLDRLERVVEDLAVSVKSLARQVGGLSEAVGANLEEFACELVPELLEKYWGMEVVSAMPEEFDVGGAPKEFDLVVRGTVNGRRVVVLGETKARVCREGRGIPGAVVGVRGQAPAPAVAGFRATTRFCTSVSRLPKACSWRCTAMPRA